jgi:hypothetical protein
MNFFGIKEAWVRNVRANFRGVWALYELVAKKTKFGSDFFLKIVRYFVFLARAPRMSFDHEILHASCVPKHL